MFIKYSATFCQTTISNLKIPQIKDFDIMTISAEIENGIFAYEKNSENLFDSKHLKNEISENMIRNSELDDIVAGFTIYSENIKEALDYDTIMNIFPHYQPEDTSHLIADIDKLYVFYPTTLLMLDQQSNAVEALNKIETICNYLCSNCFQNDSETIHQRLL